MKQVARLLLLLGAATLFIWFLGRLPEPATYEVVPLATSSAPSSPNASSVPPKEQPPSSSTTPKPSASAPPFKSTHSPLVVASIPYWDQERAFASLEKHADAIDFISVFWYFLTDSGGIEKYQYAKEDQRILDFARARGVKVFALIANLPEEAGRSWDSHLVEHVIDGKDARAKHIEDILVLVESKGFDGINIDYEALKESQKDDFSVFIEELGTALRSRGKLLKVAVERQAGSGDAHGKDWRRIAAAADQLAIMTYEEHWETSKPGPIASLPWVEVSLRYAISLGIPKEKIYMGMPFYGYDWPVEGGRASTLEWEDVMALIKKYDITPSFDKTAQAPFFTYNDGDDHEVWFENKESVKSKWELAKRLGVGGITIWRLGGEDEKVWEILKE